MLVHYALEEGRLVRVLPPREDMPSSKAHIVRWSTALRNDQRVKAFTSWLTKKTRETVGRWERVIEESLR
jgi:LysR family glycine cleavage system transcriptional activator